MKTTDALLLIVCICLIALLVSAPPSHVDAQNVANAQYAYINSAATTTVDAQAGFLQTVTINGGTPGTVTLYDIGSAGCTGTPASGKFAVIETIGSTNPTSLIYNLKTRNGLCVVTAAATDVTLSFN